MFCAYRSDNSVQGRVARWNLTLGFPAMGGEFALRCRAWSGDSTYSAKTPLRTLPSCAKTLVVPCGWDWKLKPWAFEADQVIVAWLMTRLPADPLGLVTRPRLVTGPLHRMSKLQVAGVDTGSWKWNSAFGMVKKSSTRRSVANMCAFPAANCTSTPSGADSGTVQNRPLGYG